MVDIYTKGSCMNLFVILRHIYPEAKPYYDGDHIITKIGRKYYDITGEVPPGKSILFNGPSRTYTIMMNAQLEIGYMP
jgi:hypothetical protein